MSRPRRPRTTAEAATPGSFDGETVTRRAFMTRTAQVAGAVATSAIVLPAIAFAVGPAVQREPATWHGIGPLEDVPGDDYATHVITQTPGVGVAGETTIFVRRRHPAIDTEPGDRFNQVIAITSRCAHVGCPVNYVNAARSFICPCHGGVYDFRGIRVGGPPPRPLDRFYTRVREGTVEVGPRYSVNSELRRFSPRYSGEPLDGIGQYLYPARLTTPPRPR